MAIPAKNNSAPRELTKPGLHVARCYRMIEIGTVEESFEGKPKIQQKVRIGWELPNLTKVFDEAKGPQPIVIDKEYTISMADKANLRAMLTSWRGKPYTPEQITKGIDLAKLIGQPCMINITHKPSKSDASKVYDEISSVVPMMEGLVCPPQVNPSYELSYDKWDQAKFDALPAFITDKMKTSVEYKAKFNPPPAAGAQSNNFVDANGQPTGNGVEGQNGGEDDDDLPF